MSDRGGTDAFNVETSMYHTKKRQANDRHAGLKTEIISKSHKKKHTAQQ